MELLVSLIKLMKNFGHLRMNNVKSLEKRREKAEAAHPMVSLAPGSSGQEVFYKDSSLSLRPL